MTQPAVGRQPSTYNLPPTSSHPLSRASSVLLEFPVMSHNGQVTKHQTVRISTERLNKLESIMTGNSYDASEQQQQQSSMQQMPTTTVGFDQPAVVSNTNSQHTAASSTSTQPIQRTVSVHTPVKSSNAPHPARVIHPTLSNSKSQLSSPPLSEAETKLASTSFAPRDEGKENQRATSNPPSLHDAATQNVGSIVSPPTSQHKAALITATDKLMLSGGKPPVQQSRKRKKSEPHRLPLPLTANNNAYPDQPHPQHQSIAQTQQSPTQQPPPLAKRASPSHKRNTPSRQISSRSASPATQAKPTDALTADNGVEVAPFNINGQQTTAESQNADDQQTTKTKTLLTYFNKAPYTTTTTNTNTTRPIHRQNSTATSNGTADTIQILDSSDENSQASDSYSPIQPPTTQNVKQQKNGTIKRKLNPDTQQLERELQKLQSTLNERETSLRQREHELELREREYSNRFASAEHQQRLACDAQATVDSLEQQLSEVNSLHEEYRKSVQAVLKDVLIECAVLRQRECEEKLIRDKFKIGQVVSVREGHMVHDVWEDGEQFRDIRQKLQVYDREKDEVEAMRKKLTRRKLSQARQQRKENASGSDLKDHDQDSQSASTEEFKRPANITMDPVDLEMDEIYRVRAGIIKKEIEALKEEEKRLELEKKALIRKQKLYIDQASSRFNDHRMFENRYVLLELLGKGGFSEVYKAYDLRELRYVACKIHQLNPHWSDDRKTNYTRHATREYNIHRQLKHPRVVQLYDVFAIEMNSFCTVLEYCDGPDLDMYLKSRHQLNEREARAIIMQVFSGLKYLNEQKQRIIHYDLKPGNILFNKGEVKITDFGLSKIISEDSSDAIELTSQGAGTYWYLPPECFAVDRKPMISNKVDVWSCGVILYQMLTGRKPFGHGQTPESMLQNHTMTRAKTVEFPLQNKLSDVTKEFIVKCLKYNPGERPDILNFADEHFFKYTGFKRVD